MRDIVLRVNLRITPALFRWGCAAAVLLAAAAESGTESLTLTTYYPAPSGIYNRMITTEQTLLATKNGNVGVGTTGPRAKLEVDGNAIAAYPGAANHLTTKQYVDEQILAAKQYADAQIAEATGPKTVSGTNPSCPSGYSAVSYHWLSVSGYGSACCGGTMSCTTPRQWSLSPPTCGTTLYGGGPPCSQGGCYTYTWTADKWDEVQCQR